MRTAAVPGPRVCQSPVLILGSGGRLAFPCCSESEPLQEEDGRMRVMYERVAGIDVHKGHDCAARRPVVFPAQPGGIWRVFLGLMAYLSRKAKGTIACQESSGRAHALGRGAAGPAR